VRTRSPPGCMPAIPSSQPNRSEKCKIRCMETDHTFNDLALAKVEGELDKSSKYRKRSNVNLTYWLALDVLVKDLAICEATLVPHKHCASLLCLGTSTDLCVLVLDP